MMKSNVRGFGAGMGGFGAGMGANWGPSPRAYKDGSLGDYGPLMSYQDGSLGAYGPMMSYKDGSLGMPLFLETGDGIEQLETPVTIHHGPMGEYFSPAPIGEYFSGTAGCTSGCGQIHLKEYQAPRRKIANTLVQQRKLMQKRRVNFGMGQTTGAPPSAEAVTAAMASAISSVTPNAFSSTKGTIDLSSPATVKEVKLAMVMSPWMGIALQTPEAMLDVEDPIWTKMTVQIVGAWVSGYVEFLYAQPTPPATPKATFMDALLAEGFEGEFFVPNSLGLRHIYFGATAGSIQVGQNPAEAFPILTAFLAEETASGTDGTVLPPAIEGQVPTKGNMLAIGLGVAALAIVGVAVMGKKKRG